MDALLLKPSDVVRLLGISRSKIYQLIAENKLPIVQVDGSRRVPLAALRDWIAERTDWPAATTKGDGEQS